MRETVLPEQSPRHGGAGQGERPPTECGAEGLGLGTDHPVGQDQGVLQDLRRGGQRLHHPHRYEG